jgi:hypothetical protein
MFEYIHLDKKKHYNLEFNREINKVQQQIILFPSKSINSEECFFILF